MLWLWDGFLSYPKDYVSFPLLPFLNFSEFRTIKTFWVEPPVRRMAWTTTTRRSWMWLPKSTVSVINFGRVPVMGQKRPKLSYQNILWMRFVDFGFRFLHAILLRAAKGFGRRGDTPQRLDQFIWHLERVRLRFEDWRTNKETGITVILILDEPMISCIMHRCFFCLLNYIVRHSHVRMTPAFAKDDRTHEESAGGQ